MEHKIVPERLALVAGWKEVLRPNITIILSFEAPMHEQNKYAMIRVAKLITIPAERESTLVFTTSKCGLMTIEKI